MHRRANNLDLKYLGWDTEQLGITCGLIDVTNIENPPEANVLTYWVRELIEDKKDVVFTTIKLPGNCIETVNSLVRIGALLISTELTFIYPKDSKKGSDVIHNECKLEFCKEVDCRRFLPLAEDMRFSRFFLDSNISNDKVIHLWETSIKNHCEGFADQLLVAYFDDEACGIVTLKFRDSEQLFLHIIGILKRYQGKSFCQQMLNKISKQYTKDYGIFIETPSVNIPAQTAYQKAGFKYHTLKYVLHYWSH